MRIGLAQINTTVGDFDANLERVVAAARRGKEASLVVFPEMALCGYMPRDLLWEDAFLDACEKALQRLARTSGLPPLLVGTPLRVEGAGKPLIHAAVLLRDGGTTIVAKRLIPSYDVFDERRYFRPGPACDPIEVDGTRVGVTICEDLWSGEWSNAQYDGDPIADLKAKGADLIVNVSASPYARGKPELRRRIARSHAGRHGLPIALCNLVGANNQLVFDGNSFALDGGGALCAHAAAFREDFVLTDFGGRAQAPDDDVASAIVLGIRDYFHKTGFKEALIGLSGGVDSSLLACLAAEALGPEQVTGVAMPGPFSAAISLEDAEELAGRLGIGFASLPITQAYERLRTDLGEQWGDLPFDEAEENLQARLRGVFLMALANKRDALVLVASNKSELAMGYCTLYGDMVGALAPIADLYKTEVFELAHNYDLPPRVLERPPTAELRPDQTDQDTLPPYEVLDAILALHLEQRLRPEAIVEHGFDAGLVRRVLRTVARMEFKRQQGAPVLKLGPKAFGLGRRFPIVERFSGGAP